MPGTFANMPARRTSRVSHHANFRSAAIAPRSSRPSPPPPRLPQPRAPMQSMRRRRAPARRSCVHRTRTGQIRRAKKYPARGGAFFRTRGENARATPAYRRYFLNTRLPCSDSRYAAMSFMSAMDRLCTCACMIALLRPRSGFVRPI
nr:hypothetical protein DO63_5761 [Burkholderia pseudomallei]